jgi:hypothetical protein
VHPDCHFLFVEIDVEIRETYLHISCVAYFLSLDAKIGLKMSKASLKKPTT